MKTDKQLYQLFQTNPDWLFELTRLESPGPSVFRAFSVKALQRDADGVVVPQDASKPLTVVEVQFQADDTIYARIVTEMAAVQIEQNMRVVQGIILFRYRHLDPRTQPWHQVVRSFLFRDLLESLEAEHPEHPLVAVFRPVLLSNDETLEQHAVQYYRQITQSALAEPLKTTLVEIFLSWLEQRLPHRGKKEIEAMLLGDLTPLEETQTAKDFIEIGEKRSLVTAIRRHMESQQATLPETLRQRLVTQNVESLQDLLPRVYQGMTLEQLEAWLTAQSKP